MTVTKNCKCEHKFQNETYGKNQRIYNLSEDGKKAKCTVCNNSITLGTTKTK